MTEPTDVIRLYLDDDKEPFKTAHPPLRFQFSTLQLADGPHRLRIEAHNGLAGESIKEIPFHVRNGVAITVSGLDEGQEIAGQVGIIINAYAGNTEVDFEPSRAETPQPIPTWAWLIFLVIVAWTMFYVLNPTGKSSLVAAVLPQESSSHLGERVFADTCAKCHQENGESLPEWGAQRLKDNDFVLETNPTALVTFIVAGPQESATAAGADEGTGRPRLKMPAWGTRLTNPEIVAVINHIRSSWGNQAPLIKQTLRRAPDEIQRVNSALVDALQHGDVAAVQDIYSQNPDRQVRLVRPEDRVDVSEHAGVVKAIGDWLKTIATVNSMALTPAAYAEFDSGDVVYADGTMLLTVTPKGSTQSKTYQGAFVRVYVKEYVKGDGTFTADPKEAAKGTRWRIAFDFARVPMPIGCEVPAPGGALCPPDVVAKTSYQDVVKILKSLEQSSPNAPHRNFWLQPYKDFKEFKFPYPKIPGSFIRLINLGQKVSASETNLIKALRDGNDIVVEVPGKDPVTVNIDRMPKGKPPLSAYDISRITGWISLGMPEFVGAQGDGAATGMDTPPAMDDVPAMDGTAMGETPAMTDGLEPSEGPDDYAAIQEVFRSWNRKVAGSPHKKFWELSYAEFIAFTFPADRYEVKLKLLEKGKGAQSNLIRALKGEPIVGLKADGTFVTITDLGAMPPLGKGKMPPAEDIARIQRWIDAGAPEKKPAK